MKNHLPICLSAHIRFGCRNRVIISFISLLLLGITMLLRFHFTPSSTSFVSFRSLSVRLASDVNHQEFLSSIFLRGGDVKTINSSSAIEPWPVNKPDNLTYLSDCDGCPFPSTSQLHERNASFSLQTNIQIVMFNRPEWLYPEDPDFHHAFDSCAHKCSMTNNRSAMATADAVVFHVDQLSAPSPPSHPRPERQIWIAYAMESPHHYDGHHGRAAWRGVFNWTMMYRTDSDVFNPYGVLIPRRMSAGKDYRKIASGKSKLAAWFVSNCHPPSHREKYVNELKEYMDVDVFGKCGNLDCGSKCLNLLNSTYFFYLSFENSLCRDYVTEKLFKVFNYVDVIPVVRGGADYGRYFPRRAIINTQDFPSPRMLAQELKTLRANLKRYAAMLEVKDQFQFRSVHLPCVLCRKLHQSRHTTRTYPDLMKWVAEGTCRTANDLT